MKGFNLLQVQFFVVFLLSFQGVCASDAWLSTGARSFSLGNIHSVGDEWLNPAAVSFTEGKQIGLSVFNRFQMNELNTGGCYFAFPNKYLDAGVRFSTFGYEEYRLTQLQGSFAKKIRTNLAIGIQLNYRHTRSHWEEDSQGGFSSGLGIYYRLNEQVDLALLGENLLCFSDEDVWRWLAGLQYRVSESVAFFLETGYDREKTFRFSAGVDYAIFEQFHIRSGYDSDSGMPAFGVGYNWNRWQVDVGFSFHSVLGMSSIIGVMYKF
ncbi:MAG: hypothetical protein LBB85_12810 [Dysgonamonadaceae bacterium]|jgi:hypothetical protein|nr:hypothetical protein [Dysgonamonadaceae bacterium]